jgi:hypothetical protein
VICFAQTAGFPKLSLKKSARRESTGSAGFLKVFAPLQNPYDPLPLRAHSGTIDFFYHQNPSVLRLTKKPADRPIPFQR